MHNLFGIGEVDECYTVNQMRLGILTIRFFNNVRSLFVLSKKPLCQYLCLFSCYFDSVMVWLGCAFHFIWLCLTNSTASKSEYLVHLCICFWDLFGAFIVKKAEQEKGVRLGESSMYGFSYFFLKSTIDLSLLNNHPNGEKLRVPRDIANNEAFITLRKIKAAREIAKP